ncbi:MAG TPA: hypothetical protein VFZ61_28885, partial [Polyangiales bacterium]
EAPASDDPSSSEELFLRTTMPSSLPMHCSATPLECEMGGSRLLFRNVAGAVRVLDVHWDPDQLAAIEQGSMIRLDMEPVHGAMSMTSLDDGALWLAIVRYGGRDGYSGHRWSFGPFVVTTDRPVCTATSQPCNYRLTALALRFQAEEASVTLEPGQETRVRLGRDGYRLVNDMVGLNGNAEQGEPACGAVRPALHAFSILRE